MGRPFRVLAVGVALVLGARGRRTASRAVGVAVVVLPVLTLIESTAGWDIDSDLLLLGDSLAAGLGADRPKHTLGGELSRRLARHTGRSVRLHTVAMVGAESSMLSVQLAELPSGYRADVAVLVISARKGEFETGFEKGGQTREHILLVKTAGVSKVICVINKMDDPTVDWSQTRYNEIKDKMSPFIRSAGFNLKNDVTFIPVSAYTGSNLKDRVAKSVCSWWE